MWCRDVCVYCGVWLCGLCGGECVFDQLFECVVVVVVFVCQYFVDYDVRIDVVVWQDVCVCGDFCCVVVVYVCEDVQCVCVFVVDVEMCVGIFDYQYGVVCVQDCIEIDGVQMFEFIIMLFYDVVFV